jgi:hypothetical protein
VHLLHRENATQAIYLGIGTRPTSRVAFGIVQYEAEVQSAKYKAEMFGPKRLCSLAHDLRERRLPSKCYSLVQAAIAVNTDPLLYY